MLSNLRYHILMHVIVFVWGFTGILGKLILLDHYQIVYFRIIIAGASLFLFLLAMGKNFRIKDRKTLFRVIGVGVIVTLHWLAFYKAIQASTASLGVLCLSTTTLHVSWIEPIVMKKRFSPLEFIFGILIVFGIAFISDNIKPEHLEGVLWGLVAAILAACFSVFNLKLKRDGLDSSTITLYEMLTGFVFLTIVLGLGGKFDAEFFKMTWSDFWWLLFLGTICTSIAYLFMIDVANKIGAFATSLSINLEPVYSIILAIFILNENEVLNANFYIGAGFIVFIILLNPIVKNRLKAST